MPKSTNNIKPPNRKERRKALQTTTVAKNRQNPRFHAAKLILRSSYFWIVFGITIGSFLFLVYPRIYVGPGESLDINDAFQTPFFIKNDGYLPVTDIHYSLTPNRIEFVSSYGGQITLKPITGAEGKVFFKHATEKKIPMLPPNRSTTLLLPFGEPVMKAVTHADISINLTYQLYLIPITFSEKHRFVAKPKKTGGYVWLEDYSID